MKFVQLEVIVKEEIEKDIAVAGKKGWGVERGFDVLVRDKTSGYEIFLAIVGRVNEEELVAFNLISQGCGALIGTTEFLPFDELMEQKNDFITETVADYMHSFEGDLVKVAKNDALMMAEIITTIGACPE